MSKKRKYLLSIVCAALCLGFLSFGLSKLPTYGQSMMISTSSAASSPVKPAATPLTTTQQQPLVNKTSAVSPALSASAVADNLRFRDSLSWAFGGKSQRGWYLYVPLIQHTIGTDADSGSIDFARAVALWQQKNALAPTGAIDGDTLYQMIKGWQAQRLNRPGAYAVENQLLSAPITDFYDPARGIDLLKVERETYAAYKRMLAAAAKDLNLKLTPAGDLAPDEKFLRIVSAFRSREYQMKLRAAEPNAGRAALATNSPHFTGHALDIYVGGEPIKTIDANRALQVQTPAYRWLVKNAARFGFYPYYYEPWHWEYVPQNLTGANSSGSIK